jgi:hypothetical protein
MSIGLEKFKAFHIAFHLQIIYVVKVILSTTSFIVLNGYWVSKQSLRKTICFGDQTTLIIASIIIFSIVSMLNVGIPV